MRLAAGRIDLGKVKGYVFENFSWVLLILIATLASINNPAFYSKTNLINLFLHSVVLGILVLAESVCLVTGHFDLTIESNLIFSAIIAGWLISPSSVASGWELHPLFGILLMLITGIVVGMTNGFLVSYIGMNPFITTLSMSIILSGGSVIISKGRTIYPLPNGFTFLGKGLVGDIPIAILFLIGLYILFHFILTFTTFGRKLYAVGGNKFTAKASGINVKFIVFLAYTVSGLLCSSAGWVMGGKLGTVSSIMTTGLLLYVFAAAVMGGVSLNGGEGKTLGVFGGVLLLSTISNLMNLSRINPFVITSTTGLIILLAMLISTIKSGISFRS